MAMMSLQRSLIAALFTGLALTAAPMVRADPSTQLSVGGAVLNPSTYRLADLQSLPPITQTVSFGSGAGPQTHTYTGASLWGVLNVAGIQTGTNKNDILSKYVVATGTDGYRVAFSAGELNPAFGNRPDLLAYAETINGTSATLTAADGFARVTAPGDVKGGRYVSSVDRIDVGGAAPFKVGPGGASTSFSVSGDVTHAMSFDLAALKALPATTETVGTTTYTGVSFWDLLNTTVGLSTNPKVKNDLLGRVVVATGSDGYRAAFSLGELSPAFGNQPDLIAYAANGAPLTDNGFARIVVPNDIKAGRFVSNLVNLDVFHAVTPVPEPASLALMLAGLSVLGWKIRRARPGSR